MAIEVIGCFGIIDKHKHPNETSDRRKCNECKNTFDDDKCNHFRTEMEFNTMVIC